MPRDPKDDPALLWDMLHYARVVRSIVRDREFSEYSTNNEFRLAVERGVEIIGEAARHISSEFVADHPDIEWRAIRAQRHILAHEYGEIQDDKIWRVATEHVPALITQLEPLIADMPEEEKTDPS